MKPVCGKKVTYTHHGSTFNHPFDKKDCRYTPLRYSEYHTNSITFGIFRKMDL